MTDRHPRVISLLPSVTETLRTWGIDPVACTRFCEQPDLPTVGGTKDPDIDAIAALRPDAVILDTEENRIEDARALQGRDIEVVVTDVHSVADVGPALAALAVVMGVAFDPVAFDAAVADSVTEAGEPVRTGPRTGEVEAVYVPIWRRPWMTIGGDTYGSSVLEELGLANAFARAADRYPQADPAAAVAAGARRVLAPSEPYPFAARHVPELAVVGPVALIDGRDLFWWGIRTPAAIRRLAAAIRG